MSSEAVSGFKEALGWVRVRVVNRMSCHGSHVIMREVTMVCKAIAAIDLVPL